jgi:hypothetical protein
VRKQRDTAQRVRARERRLAFERQPYQPGVVMPTSNMPSPTIFGPSIDPTPGSIVDTDTIEPGGSGL